MEEGIEIRKLKVNSELGLTLAAALKSETAYE